MISVIVPVYNVELYLCRCVNSILAQTFSDFELILVDDGSPDCCGKMCDEFAKKDKRVHVIHQQNGGLSAARNAGIDWVFANSDSKWITFIDSDDWVDECMLEKTIFRGEQDDADMVVFDHVQVFENSDGWHVDKNNYLSDEVLSNIEAVNKLSTADWWLYVHAWHKLYRRELFSDIRFPVGYIHEDNSIVHHLFYASKKVICMHDQLYYYWQRSTSIMGTTINVSRTDDLSAWADRIQFARDKELKLLEKNTVVMYVDLFWKLYPIITVNQHDKLHMSRIVNSVKIALPSILNNRQVSFGRKVRFSVFVIAPYLYMRVADCFSKK